MSLVIGSLANLVAQLKEAFSSVFEVWGKGFRQLIRASPAAGSKPLQDTAHDGGGRGSNTIGFPELSAAIVRFSDDDAIENKLIEAFNPCNRFGKGSSATELRHAMSQLAGVLTDVQIDGLIKEALKPKSREQPLRP